MSFAWITNYFARHTSRLVEDNYEKFELPNVYVLWFIAFVSYNVLLQGFADIVLKVLSNVAIIPPLPLQIDFLFLTATSVLMGYQALMGMRRREVDVTRNSLSLGILVECGLVVSEFANLYAYQAVYPYLIWFRLPFIVLTTINLVLLIYIAARLHIFRDAKGKFRLS